MNSSIPTHTVDELALSVDYGVTASANSSAVGPHFLRISDIQDDHVDWSTVPFCATRASDEERARLQVGDILFARTDATTGKSYLVRSCPARSVFASYLIRVRPNLSRVDPRYLAWYFQSPEYWQQIAASATGTAQPGVNANKLKGVLVPTLRLPEQRRIADILDKADAIRRKHKEAIALTEQLLRSAFLEMFGDPVTNPKGWDIVTIGELCARGASLVDGPFGSSLKPEHYTQAGVRVIRNWNIYDDVFDGGAFKYVSPGKFEEIQRSAVVLGDILMTTKGTVGDICLMPDLEGRAVLSASGTVRLRLPDQRQILGPFVVRQMIASSYKAYMRSFEAGSAQRYLNLSAIRKMKLIVPPLRLQEKFVETRRISHVLYARLKSASLESASLFDSLVHRSFARGSNSTALSE